MLTESIKSHPVRLNHIRDQSLVIKVGDHCRGVASGGAPVRHTVVIGKVKDGVDVYPLIVSYVSVSPGSQCGAQCLSAVRWYYNSSPSETPDMAWWRTYHEADELEREEIFKNTIKAMEMVHSDKCMLIFSDNNKPLDMLNIRAMCESLKMEKLPSAMNGNSGNPITFYASYTEGRKIEPEKTAVNKK